METAPYLAAAERFIEPLLADLAALVNINSGSFTPAGVARIAEELRPRFDALGFTTELRPGQELGPNLIARWQGTGLGRVLLVGHMDTVFPAGEAERRPFTMRDGRAFGPGVLDMKSGLLVGLYALRTLLESGALPLAEVTFLCNSDEEIGSPESHDLVATLAGAADAVLVLEPGSDVNKLTTARKGVGMYRLEVSGVAAHAGVEPRKGRSAIVQLAHHVLALHALNGSIKGVTINVGVVAGGERPNVVPDWARAEIDVRAADRAGVEAVAAALARVATETTIPDTETRLSGGMRHQPFQQSEASAALFALAREVGQPLGLELRGAATGGASDGNTAAALGVPTLDGLGPAGGLAHNPGEFVEIASIAPRVALLAGLLARLGDGAA